MKPSLRSRDGCFAAALARLRPHSDEARLEVIRIFEAVLQIGYAELIAHGEVEVSDSAYERIDAYVKRRVHGEPIAYILGESVFYGRRFFVDARVLVPRPETELVIELARAHLHAGPNAAPRVLDVGTGSGAIALTLALECERARVTAVDICAEALNVAERNRHLHGLEHRVVLCKSDLTAELQYDDASFDVVTANLPYLRSDEMPVRPEATAFEPVRALDGGLDGIELYRRLFAELPPLLARGALLLCEAAPPTMPALADLAAARFPHARRRVERDYGGAERVLAIAW